MTDRVRGGICGKARYTSAGAARHAIHTLERRGLARSYDGRLHAYPCKHCRAWHVGHTNRRDR